MVFQNHLGDGLQRTDYSGKLHQNVRAVLAFVHHRADVLQMPGRSCQPVLNVLRVFVVVRVLVPVRVVMPVRMRVVVVMRVVVLMEMLLFQFIHIHHRLSYFVFYKILRRTVSLPGGYNFRHGSEIGTPSGGKMRNERIFWTVFNETAT